MLKTKSGRDVSKLGIGTWTINKENLQNEVEVLKFYYDQNVNFIDVVLAYDSGKTLDVIAEFLKKVPREDIFVNAFITAGCEFVEDIEKQIDTYLARLGTDYLDQVTLHSLDCIDFEFDDYVAEINRLKSTNKFLNIGYSNLDPAKLEKVANHTNYFEGLFNLENKINEDNEILKTCKENAIPFYAYQPLRRNRTAKQNYPVLVELSQKYQKTQNQIILNWLLIHKKIGVLVKSSNKEHIAENIGALGFVMEEEDYVVLDKFRNTEFDKLLVSYKTEEGKVRIDQIPNQPIGVL